MLSKKFITATAALACVVSLQANDPFANDPFFADPFGNDMLRDMIQMQKNMDRMMNQMQHRVDRLSSANGTRLGSYPVVAKSQFQDRGDRYEISTDIPESKDNNIKITIDNHILSINAKIIKKIENKTVNGVSYQSYMSSYSQSMSVPADADESSMKSEYRDGKLVISLGKKKKPKDNNMSKK